MTEAKQFPKYTPNPLLEGLSEYLKQPEAFEKIQKAILNTLASRHSHSEVLEYAECFSCSKKMLDSRLLLKKLGFKSPMQYREWVKVHKRMAELQPIIDKYKQ